MIQILIQYPHIIITVLWFLVSVSALLRYARYSFFSRVSWRALVVGAVVLHVVYIMLLTWGQHAQWASNPFTQTFLSKPLDPTVPLPFLLEWSRSFLEQPLGYFTFYVFGRFWLNVIILFGLTGFFVTLLLLRAYYRPFNFREGEIAAITLALLISGWPGVVVLLPLAFFFAVIFSIISLMLYRVSRIYLAPAFLVAAPIALVAGPFVLKFFKLYTLFKL